MKHLLMSLAAGALLGGPAFGLTVTVNVDASQQGTAISSNFVGLSFETGEMKQNNGTVTGFVLDNNSQSPNCGQVQQLAENMGLANIRIGGDTVDTNVFYQGTGATPPSGYTFDEDGVDALFAFAKKTGINVIYSVRLLGSSSYDPMADSTNAAAYVWKNHQAYLDFLAIGNEPNYQSYHTIDPRIYDATSGDPGSAYPSYLADWKRIAGNIVAQSGVSGAVFGGPDTGDTGTSTTTWWNGSSWTQDLVADRKSGNITEPIIAGLTHWYIGGGGTSGEKSSQLTATTDMLSSTWVTGNYPTEYTDITEPVVADGWHYRFTECNDFLDNVTPASATFASALWALDFMCWEAAHNQSALCQGVDFMNEMGSESSPPTTAVIYEDTAGNYQAHPKAAALKMFALASQGASTMSSWSVNESPSGEPVDCYAFGNSTDLYITVVNKTSQYVGNWVAAPVTVVPTNFTVAHATYIEMDSYPTTKDVTASDATVGGSRVSNNSAAWSGTWTTTGVTIGGNQVSVTVPSASAGILHLTTY